MIKFTVYQTYISSPVGFHCGTWNHRVRVGASGFRGWHIGATLPYLSLRYRGVRRFVCQLRYDDFSVAL